MAIVQPDIQAADRDEQRVETLKQKLLAGLDGESRQAVAMQLHRALADFKPEEVDVYSLFLPRFVLRARAASEDLLHDRQPAMFSETMRNTLHEVVEAADYKYVLTAETAHLSPMEKDDLRSAARKTLIYGQSLSPKQFECYVTFLSELFKKS